MPSIPHHFSVGGNDATRATKATFVGNVSRAVATPRIFHENHGLLDAPSVAVVERDCPGNSDFADDTHAQAGEASVAAKAVVIPVHFMRQA